MDIKAIRKRLGLSQVKFAKGLGAPRMTIHRWETGKCEPSPAYRKVMEIVYGIKEVKSESNSR